MLKACKEYVAFDQNCFHVFQVHLKLIGIQIIALRAEHLMGFISVHLARNHFFLLLKNKTCSTSTFKISVSSIFFLIKSSTSLKFLLDVNYFTYIGNIF